MCRSESTPDETPTPVPPAATNARLTVTGVIRGLSLSRVQSVVAILAGVVSVIGAASSVAQFVRPGNTGELVAFVRATGTQRSVPDAMVEVLTPDNAIVATLRPDASGRVTQELQEGVYLVRVSHPRYAADVRRIQVQAGQTIEITSRLRQGSSSPIERTVNKGVGAVRRALGF
jgi:hypothetical protein